jgi:hypothetical protein
MGFCWLCYRLRAAFCAGFHCLSLHVSAYMAIFRCVGYFILICLKDSASLVFAFFFFLHVVTLCTVPSVVWVKYKVVLLLLLLLLLYAIFGTVICVFFTYLCFPVL